MMNAQQNSEKAYCYQIKGGQQISKQYSCLLGMCNDEIELGNLVSLSEILPLKIVDLLLYLYHLCEYVLELQRREMSVQNLNLKEIKVSKDKNIPFVYLSAKSKKISCKQLSYQIQAICFRLNLPMQIYHNNEVQKIAENILEQYLQLIGKDKSKLHYEKQFLNIWRTLVGIYNIPSTELQPNNVSKAITGKIKRPSFLTTDQDNVFVKFTRKDHDCHHLREIHILEQCYECPNLPKIYGYFRYQTILITFSKIHKITLEQFNKRIMEHYENSKITQQQVSQIHLTIFQNLIEGIQYLHKNAIVHRDLKPLNIMLDYEDEDEIIDNPQKLQVIIIDFDNSINLSDTESMRSQQFASNYMGTELYAPPEIAESNLNYTDKVDIYQLGLIFLDMIKGCRQLLQDYKRRPIEEIKFNEFISKVKKYENKINQNENLINLFLRMISFRQENRPSTEIVLKEFGKITKKN